MRSPHTGSAHSTENPPQPQAVPWVLLRAGISAGVIAGMLGLGGGLVLAPLMLELGVDPAVSAASTQVRL